MRNRVLACAAIGELATGLALVVAPLLVGRLLLGAEFSDVSVIAGRVAGLALIALGIACWPYGSPSRALSGMLTYSTLVTFYLFYVALGGKWTGPLLWPVVVLHAVLTVLLAWLWIKSRENRQA